MLASEKQALYELARREGVTQAVLIRRRLPEVFGTQNLGIRPAGQGHDFGERWRKPRRED